MSGIVTILTAVVAFSVSAATGLWLIPLLRRVHYGQISKDIGPTWHKKKEGTPLMGGFLFIIGSLAAAVTGFCALRIVGSGGGGLYPVGSIAATRLFMGLLMSLAFGMIGFMDDYTKAVKKNSMGASERERTVMEVLVAGAYLAGMYIAGDTSTIVPVPFIGQVDMGLFYYPFAILVIYGAVNAVNITDGIDGLCGSITFVAAIGFMLSAALLAAPEMELLATALAGACLGFLVWNFHPAKIFMGDTGSLFLGGMLVAVAFGLSQPFLLLFMGIVYVLETLSDILQIGSYKLTHKRIFKMAPIHHHFEMCGWSEMKIVLVFSAVAVAGSAIGVLSVMNQ
ncbi:MAG: phospho-N-acetylmuramoyl-pentapeptide-transferase [Provencibacterium sp.]|jgi:phospho-N-acetylmuramoyl-pentapeptide-transferase|nr:phospho-N-acetylmuramoyl-pentapeptide-transferase [Provencibacterium sp.]